MAKQGKSTAGKHYDVFISYRRSSSESAQLIATHLRAAGYRVFIDVENLRSGKFNEQLYWVIDQCKDFLVILPENALDRCKDPEDWVRKEVIYAMEKEKNIIPIMLSGFSWPEPMPDGMESLREYQAITTTSREYFDLSMERLKKYLKSRSYARILKTLLVIFLIVVLTVIPLFLQVSSDLCNKVADLMTMQSHFVDLAVDSSERLADTWSSFLPAFREADPQEKKGLLENLSLNVSLLEKDVLDLRFQLFPYLFPQLSPWEKLLLELRGVSSGDVGASSPLCHSYFTDIEENIAALREVISDEQISLDEERIIGDNIDIFRHSANIFLFGYLDLMTTMPKAAQAKFNEQVLRWHHLPNGLGLKHSRNEYQKLIDQELDYLSSVGRDLSNRAQKQEQELLELKKILDEQIAQYEALYEQVKASARVDSTKTPMEIFTNIVILSSFMKEALDIEADVESIDHPVTPSQVLQDLEKALKEFSAAYPALEPVSRGAARYYRGVSEGKYPYGGLVTIGSMTPKLAVGDVVTSINGKKTIPANYNSIGEAIQSSAIRSVDYLRLEEGSFHAGKADLSKEENSLAFWPMGAGE